MSTRRPARNASGRAGATAARGGVPFARRSTRRLAVLGAVFVLLAIMLAPTVRAYLVQQQEYAALQEQVSRQEQTVGDLQARVERWQDPAFVEQQARERLKFVKPGETVYRVIGAEKLLGDPLSGHGAVVNPQQGDDSVSWYGRMWSSLVIADRLSTDRRTAPLTPVGGDDDSTTPGDNAVPTDGSDANRP